MTERLSPSLVCMCVCDGSIPAPSKVSSHVPSLVTSLRVWCHPGAMERRGTAVSTYYIMDHFVEEQADLAALGSLSAQRNLNVSESEEVKRERGTHTAVSSHTLLCRHTHTAVSSHTHCCVVTLACSGR